MKTSNYFKIFLVSIATFVLVMTTAAQNTKPTDTQAQDVQQPNTNRAQDVRTNMLRQLGLSQEQIRQIRLMNAQRKPLMDEAQKRFREANRALDEAIYADEVNESDVQARLKEVQLAQAEVARVRYMNELSVRRILTPDQLIRFRELRQKFEQTRENFETRRPLNGERNVDRQLLRDKFKNRGDGLQQTRPAVRPNQQRPNL